MLCLDVFWSFKNIKFIKEDGMSTWQDELVVIGAITIIFFVVLEINRMITRRRMVKFLREYKEVKNETEDLISQLKNLQPHFRTDRVITLANECQDTVEIIYGNESIPNLKRKIFEYSGIRKELKRVADNPLAYLGTDFSDPLDNSPLFTPTELKFIHPVKGEFSVMVNVHNRDKYLRSKGQAFPSIALPKEKKFYFVRVKSETERPNEGFGIFTAEAFREVFCSQATGQLLDMSFPNNK